MRTWQQAMFEGNLRFAVLCAWCGYVWFLNIWNADTIWFVNVLNVHVNCHQGSHQMDSSRQEVEVESHIKINVFNGEDKLSFYCFVVNMLDRDNERIKFGYVVTWLWLFTRLERITNNNKQHGTVIIHFTTSIFVMNIKLVICL